MLEKKSYIQSKVPMSENMLVWEMVPPLVEMQQAENLGHWHQHEGLKNRGALIAFHETTVILRQCQRTSGLVPKGLWYLGCSDDCTRGKHNVFHFVIQLNPFN